MNPAQLLKHFDRIAEAPDAVPRLRRFILDLAVRGKLVEQNPNDEPASELLKRIVAEKAQLVKQGAIRKEKSLLPVKEDAIPFELPSKWAWARLGNVIHLVSGQHLQPSEYSEHPEAGLPYITGPSDFGVDGLRITRFALVRKAVAKRGQLLLTVKGSGVGKTTTCDLAEVAISRQLMALTAIIWDSRFLVLVTHLLAEILREQARSLIPGISRADVDQFVVALPPLAEQHRIVAKVDELMALCDRLEAAQNKREQRRDRLAAASLNRINQPAPSAEGEAATAFREHARFHLGYLPRLTTRPEHIKSLRQTILSLAVRGQLVPQHPNDQPIDETLRTVLDRRASLIRQKKARQKKHDQLEAPTKEKDLPATWAVERLGNLVDPQSTISYGVLVPGSDVADGVPFVRAQDLALSSHPERPNKSIAPEIESAYARTRLQGGEILLCVVGSIGKVGVVPSAWAGANIARAVARILPVPEVFRDYLLVVLQAKPLQTYFTEATRTLAQPTLNVALIEQAPIPLPPLAEQHRIVAKVDELMAVCDQLESRLTSTQTDSRRLLEAVLFKSLAPAIEEAA